MITLPIGGTFAGYVVDAVVARGGMGVVYRATQLQPRRRVALKLIAPEYAADAKYRERFLREADLLASLDDCPSIVPIYASGEADGQLYLAMRFLDGPDLATLLNTDGPLSLAQTVRILTPVAVALDAAHEAGLVHRDVKPSNVMLDRRSAVYLMDFGLTKRTDSESGLTRPGQAIGTAGYMAPEQFTGRVSDPALAPRIDIYALGCVLHACLTGEEPYPRDSYEQALFAHVYEPPPKVSTRRSDIPSSMDGILARALAKDPNERFAGASDLIDALREIEAAAPGIPVRDLDDATTVAPDGPAGHQVPLAVPPPPDQRRSLSPSGPHPPDELRPPDELPPPAIESARHIQQPTRVAARPQPSAVRRPQVVIGVGGLAIVVLLGVLALGSFRPAARSNSTDPATPYPTSASPSDTRPTDAPTPPPQTAPPSETAPPPVTPAPEPTDRFGSPAAVQELVDRLPASIADTCKTSQVYSDESSAAVMCDRPGGLIWYTLFQDKAAMDAAYESTRDYSGVARDSGTCEGGKVGEAPWNFPPAEGQPVVEEGRLLCRTTTDGTAFLDFTTDGALTLGSMLDTDGNLKALYDAWVNGDVVPTVPGSVGEALAITLVAKGIEFTPAAISVPAGRPLAVTLDNQDDGVPHSLVLKAGAGFTVELAKSVVQVGPAKLQPLLVPALVPGPYRWTCEVHPNMTVDMTVEGGG